MKDFEYYQDLDLRYPELAICLEDANENGIAKFYIPVLTPILDSSRAYDQTDLRVSKSNILNDSSSMDIRACTSSNYIELQLPEVYRANCEYSASCGECGITTYKPNHKKYDTCRKGDKFAILFIGGDPNKPFILGRYYDAIN